MQRTIGISGNQAMTKLVASLALLAALALPVSATITIQDTCFNNNCSASGDVIGQPSRFDIDRIVVSQFNSTGLSLSVFTNYQNGASLGNFPFLNRNLNLGDLLFTQGGAVTFGVPLLSRGPGTGPGTVDPNNSNDIPAGAGSVTGGMLYQVGFGGTLTALNVLKSGNTPMNATYRTNQIVWIMDNSGTLIPVSAGAVNPIGSGVGTNPQWQINVWVPLSSNNPFYLAGLGGLGVSFASATCGNDVITGNIWAAEDEFSKVPEPSTYALMGVGLITIGFLNRRRRR